jgi:hypothetical protein
MHRSPEPDQSACVRTIAHAALHHISGLASAPTIADTGNPLEDAATSVGPGRSGSSCG